MQLFFVFFCFLGSSEEKLCSILIFWNVRYNKVVWINHDIVASRGAVGRTHPIVRLQTRIRRKMDRGEFRGFRICVGWISTTGFCVGGFLRPNNISLFFDSIFASILCQLCVSSTVTTPRATTPHLYCKGYHAFTTARLPRLCIYIPAITPQFRVPFLSHHT